MTFNNRGGGTTLLILGLGTKNDSKKSWVLKDSGQKPFWVQKEFGSKKSLGSKKYQVQRKFGPKKMGQEFFG